MWYDTLMAAKRLDKTLADYVTIALSPVLLIALVGSLMFFLVEVFYTGDYAERMKWIMSCFVLAIVLIARIAIEDSPERAMLFGGALALAVGLAILRFVDNPLVGWAILAVVWWSAHKLTYDCTLIDDEQDASGEGLLQLAGLEPGPVEQVDAHGHAGEQDGNEPASSARPGLSDDRFARGQQTDLPTPTQPKRRRKTAPGVWVVYYSLAALPLFGLGQWMVPSSDLDRRRELFWLIGIYVASALALLMTTSFLGLRRYLRQRKLEMPPAMTGVWLSAGGVMILVLLLLCAFVPRPNPEYAISSLTGTLGSPDQEASDYAMLDDSGVEDSPDGAAGEASPEGDASNQEAEPSSEADSSSDVSSDGGSGDRSGEGSQSGDSRQSGGRQPGKASDGNQPGDGRSEGGQSGDQQSGDQQSSGDKPSGGGNQGQRKPGQGQGRSGQGQAGAQRSDGQQGNSGQQGSHSSGGQSGGQQGSQSGRQQGSQSGRQQGRGTPQGQQPDQGESSQGRQQQDFHQHDAPARSQQEQSSSEQAEEQGSPPEPPAEASESSESWTPQLPDIGSWLSTGFRWILNLVLALAAGYVLIRYWREIGTGLRQLLDSLRDFWNRWFGARGRKPASLADQVPESRPRRAFASFVDPFLSGSAGRMSAEDLVGYSFAALEAWADERGHSRRTDETPLEFADRLAHVAPEAAAHFRELASWYARVAYARQPLTAAGRDALRRFWLALPTAGMEAVVS
jgi:hypothetical protein